MKNSRQAIRLPLYIGVAITIGILIGAQMAGNSKSPELLKSLYKLKQIVTFIEGDYVDEVDTEELVENMIEEMLVELDPHTVYIPASEMRLMAGELQGNYQGIGVQFDIFRDTVIVIEPLEGGPSKELGIQQGDKILSVDGENIAGIGINIRGVITRLKGPEGTEVNVTVLKAGGDKLILEYTIERGVIPQYSVDLSYMIEDEVGYIKVNQFASTTYMEFKEALFKLQEQGMTKLILDLTGNGGGYMNMAVDMVDEFLAGNKLIVFTQGKEEKYNENHISRRKGDFEQGSLIVLIDELSASASEIVAGALQDHDRGLVVGRRSFGKGLVQLPIPLNDGSQLRLTISRYYTPSGRCIQKPYSDIDEYHSEYASRFQNGEVFTEDSVYINDSLVFETENGRPVYGGGGIIPDVFVPYDTSGNSVYFNRLFVTRTIQEFALSYASDNADELERKGLEHFREQFEISDMMLKDVIQAAEKNDLKLDQDGFDKSKGKIKLYLKAFIGRRIWDNDGFYPILHTEDEIIQAALTKFEEASALPGTGI